MVQIAPKVWVEITCSTIPETEKEFVLDGLQRVVKSINYHMRSTDAIVITVSRVSFNPCDYQSEGLVHAVANWAAELLGFPKPVVEVGFDKEKRTYSFIWSDSDQSKQA